MEGPPRIRIGIIGYGGVGKTTILHMYRGELLSIDPAGVRFVEPLEDLKQAEVIVSGPKLRTFRAIRDKDLVLLVTDSTTENVLRSQKLIEIAKRFEPDIRLIVIANKQDLPTALHPEEIEGILGIPTYGLSAIDATEHTKLFDIIRGNL